MGFGAAQAERTKPIINNQTEPLKHHTLSCFTLSKDEHHALNRIPGFGLSAFFFILNMNSFFLCH